MLTVTEVLQWIVHIEQSSRCGLPAWAPVSGCVTMCDLTCLISCFGASDGKDLSKTKIVSPTPTPGKSPGQYVCVFPGCCSVYNVPLSPTVYELFCPIVYQVSNRLSTVQVFILEFLCLGDAFVFSLHVFLI